MIANVIHSVLGAGTLSTDRSESSYGLPVLLSHARLGVALDVGDAPGTCAPAPGETDTGDLCGIWNYLHGIWGAGRRSAVPSAADAARARAARGEGLAAAARENGKKGGRPRKSLFVIPLP